MTDVTAALTGMRLQVRVQPRAARNRIVGWHGDALKIQVYAPPAKGAANAAVIELLAETLAVPRRAIRIVNGATSRSKIVEIHGTDPTACAQRLGDAIARVDKGKGRG